MAMEDFVTSLDLHTRGGVRAARTNHYLVTGSNIKELRDAVALLGPKRDGRAFGGFTAWALRWTFAARPNGRGFETTRITVAVDAIVTLPRWEMTRSAEGATRTEWNRYVLALADHEAGHVAVATAAADDVAALLHDLQAESPLSLHRKGDRLARERVAIARSEEDAYDVRTRHGLSQGARLGLAQASRLEPESSRCA